MQTIKVLFLSFCIACAYSNLAFADTSTSTATATGTATSTSALTLGHCLTRNSDKTCALSFNPDLLTALVGINAKTGKAFFGPTSLGGCYGITYQPEQWYATGFDLCFNWQLSQSSPNVLWPSGAIHVLKYGAVDVGPQCTLGTDGFCQWIVLWSANVPVTM